MDHGKCFVRVHIRGVDSPSGVTRMGLAIKVYRDRSRGHNEYYTPKVKYDGNIGDTKAVMDWIRKI